MNLVGPMIKSCAAWGASHKIWLRTNQVRYSGELFNILFIYITYIYLYIWERQIVHNNYKPNINIDM